MLKRLSIGILFLVFLLLSINMMINPTGVSVYAIFLFIGLIFFLIAKQEYLIYATIFVSYFPFAINTFKTNISNAVILLLCSVLFIRFTFERKGILTFRGIIKSSGFIPGVIILANYLIALVLAPKALLHYQFVISMVCGVILMSVISTFITTEERYGRVMLVLTVILIINLIFGFITFFQPNFVLIGQWFESSTKVVGGGLDGAIRLGGLNFHGEGYGGYLMVASVFLIGLYMVRSIHKRWIFIPLIIPVVMELLLSNTRGAIVLFVIGLLCIPFVNSEFKVRDRIRILVLAFLIVTVLLGLSMMIDEVRLFERFSNFFEFTSTKYGILPERRAGAWVPIIDLIIESDFFGIGPSFIPKAHEYSEIRVHAWPHNLFLLIFVTLGFTGIFTYGILFLKAVLTLRTIHKIHSRFMKMNLLLVWLAFMCFLIYAQKFDGFLRNPDPQFYFFWQFLGILFSAKNFVKSGKITENQKE